MCSGDETESTAPAAGAENAAVAAYVQQLARYQVRVARVKSILPDRTCGTEILPFWHRDGRHGKNMTGVDRQNILDAKL